MQASSLGFRVKAQMQNEAADAARPGKSGVGPSLKTQQDAISIPTRYQRIKRVEAQIIWCICMYMLQKLIYLLCFDFC